jgi:phage terminase small subunit
MLFVREYLVDLNGGKACERAGYECKSPAAFRVQASKMLAMPNIRAAVDQNLAERGARIQVTADRVMEEIAKVAFSELRHVADWKADEHGLELVPAEDLDDDASAAIQEISTKRSYNHQTEETTVTVKVKMHDKLRALDMLGRHLGMWKGVDEEAEKWRRMTTEELLVAAKTFIPKLMESTNGPAKEPEHQVQRAVREGGAPEGAAEETAG